MKSQSQAQQMTDNFFSLFEDLAATNRKLDQMIKSAESFAGDQVVQSNSQIEAIRKLKQAKSEARDTLRALLKVRELGLQVFDEQGTPTICPCEEARLAA